MGRINLVGRSVGRCDDASNQQRYRNGRLRQHCRVAQQFVRWLIQLPDSGQERSRNVALVAVRQCLVQLCGQVQRIAPRVLEGTLHCVQTTAVNKRRGNVDGQRVIAKQIADRTSSVAIPR